MAELMDISMVRGQYPLPPFLRKIFHPKTLGVDLICAAKGSPSKRGFRRRPFVKSVEQIQGSFDFASLRFGFAQDDDLDVFRRWVRR
jgi:hypothetical protein